MFCPGMSGTQASKKDWAKEGRRNVKENAK